MLGVEVGVAEGVSVGVQHDLDFSLVGAETCADRGVIRMFPDNLSKSSPLITPGQGLNILNTQGGPARVENLSSPIPSTHSAWVDVPVLQ